MKAVFEIVLVVVLFMGFAKVSTAGTTHKILGHHTAAMAKALYVGEVESTRRFHIAVSLPLRNQDDLGQLLKDLYDHKSSSFHHFLNPDDFTARYGPTAEDAQAVADYFSSRGFVVKKIHSNRVIVDVEGDNEAIQKALHVKLHNYQRPDGTSFYGPDDDPSIDIDTPIASLSGIDNFTQPRHSGVVTRKSAIAPTNLATDGFVAPIDLRNAYAGNVTLKGSGQSVALVEFSNYSASDLGPFQAAAVTYNAQAAAMYSSFGPIQNVYLDGLSAASTFSTDDQEAIAQDIENVESVSPLATLYIYMGGNVEDDLNQIATDNICKQITTSALYSTSGAAFMQFAAQGQSAFNSAGDWYSYDNPNNVENGNDTDPNHYAESDLNYEYATIVGGTELTMTGSAYTSEIAWNQGNAATGGGILTLVPIPSYQTGINMSTNGGSTNYRNAPDVSACAYGIWIYENGGWAAYGGTSSSTPIWAAYMSLVNQQAAISGAPYVGWPNPAIYAIGENATKYAADFHDITSGNNGGYNAVAGFDLVTGWGSPNGQSLINDLVGIASQPTATFTATPTANRTQTNTFTATLTPSFTFTMTATATQGQGGNCSGLPTWTSTGMPLYQAGTLVVYQGNEYKALVTTYGLDAYTPGSTPTVWQLIGVCGTAATNTPVFTSTATSTPTLTNSSTVTRTPTNTWTNTMTSTVTNTNSPTASFTSTATNSNILTSTFTSTPTWTKTNTSTSTPALTFTPTNSGTATFSSTTTATLTQTKSPTVTFTQTNTETKTFTGTPTATATNTAIAFTATFTPTKTVVPSTATFTKTPSATSTSASACSGVPAWNGNFVAYSIGTKVVYNNELYQCIQAHTSEPNWTPAAVASLWKDLGPCLGTSMSSSTVIKTALAGPNISKNMQPVKFFIQLNASAQVTVDIFTPMGQLVASSSFYGNPGMNNWLWDIHNASKQIVSSGLYIYTIQTTANGLEEKKTGKIVIMH